MRFLLAIALILLFLWLYKAQMSYGTSPADPCEKACLSKAAVSVLLSPLSLYSWFTSMLLTLILYVPVLVLSSLHHSLLLLLAGPWCVMSVCISLLLTCFLISLYLLHVALVLATMAALPLTLDKEKDDPPAINRLLYKHKKPLRSNSRPRIFAFQG